MRERGDEMALRNIRVRREGALGRRPPLGRLSPVSRESRRGVTVLRANGTRFRIRRFAGRASNYVTYFGSAALATLAVGRPDVVVSLTDPPIVGLAAWAAARLRRLTSLLSR